MKNFVSNRFEVTRILKQDRTKISFLGTDHQLKRPDLLVKIVRRGQFHADRDSLAYSFAWHCGVEHPHLARMLDAGITSRGHLYYVREFFEQRPARLSTNSDFPSGVIAAVSLLHMGNKVHGSIKPSNIFYAEGLVKLADPMLMKLLRQQIDEEYVRFTAPEVLSGAAPTAESDIYSIGAILYRAYAGRDAFEDFNLATLKSKYMWACPKSLDTICYLNKPIADLVSRALNKNPQSRPTLAMFQQVFTSAARIVRVPFVGRSKEMASAQKWMFRSPSQGLRVLVIEGEPGIGKTRFVEELGRMVAFQSGHFAVGHCAETYGRPFEAFIRPLELLLRQSAFKHGGTIKQEAGNFWSTLFRDLFGENQNATMHYEQDMLPERVVSDIVGLLRSLAQRAFITLAIEDVDRAAANTLRVLEQLLLRSSEIPVNLILTRRMTVQQLSRLTNLMSMCSHEHISLRLEPLEIAAARKLLAYLAVPPQRCDRILEASSGNTLLIEEYGQDERRVDRCGARIEKTVSSVVAFLSESARELSIALSVFPGATRIGLIQGMLSPPAKDFQSAIGELVSAGLIAASDVGACFKNESYRLKIYSTVTKGRRVRLHQLAFSLLQNHGAEAEELAYHSYRGRLLDQASVLCLKVAADLYRRGKYTDAIEFFNQARLSLRTNGQQLDSAAQSDLALCYLRVGQNAAADRIYRELLRQAPRESERRTLLSSIYDTLAAPESKNSLSEQARLCALAIETSPVDSPNLTRLYAHLGQLLVQTGNMSNAAKALAYAEDGFRKHPTESNVVAGCARGYLLLHLGHFREAIEILTAVKTENQNTLASVLTNVALCWEHLGDLKRARHFQLRAQTAAEVSGSVLLQILSFVNLGAFAFKSGDLIEASHSFADAENLVSGLRVRDRSFRPPMASALNLDLAQLQIELGLYRKAANNLKQAGRCGTFGIEGGYLLINRCKLHLCYNDQRTVQTLLQSFDDSEFFRTDFFLGERLLIESRLDVSRDETNVSRLLHAFEISDKLGTKYQTCEVLHRLALTLLGLNRRHEAKERAEESLRIAQRNGYKILGIRSLAAVALTSEDVEERHNKLLSALHDASEIGLPELIAEIAFQIGAQQIAEGRFVTAEEYLTRSTSITRAIAEEVPLRFRLKYLSQPWRVKAQSLLLDCVNKTQSTSYCFREGPLKQHGAENHFRALYRLTLASVHIRKLEDITGCLLQALESSMLRPVVLMLKDGDGTLWHSLRIKITDDVRARVQSLAKKSHDKTFFGSLDERRTDDTVAWIPLVARGCIGGCYIGSRAHETAFSEDEMEFLTILGTLANAALTQIDNIRVHLSTELTEFHGMIGASTVIREVYSQVEIAAGNAATVLIEGESGTGKELVARAIHQAGARAKEPFIPLDCGAIPEGLIEAELFGAKRGSYTGAVVDRPGLFEAAHRGTIFLDEISNTTPALQGKLLRVIQEREIRRLGETKGRPIDVRLIVASNSNLDALAQDGRFRRDLLYRLKVLYIKVPPLRNRRDDIPMLAHAFLERLNAANKTKKYFAAGIVNRLATKNFPGNVRELQNAIERAFFSTRGTHISEVTLEDRSEQVLPDEIETWFKELSEGRKDFWSAVHKRYKRRDISREKVIALVDLGLRSARGNYKTMAAMFHLKGKDYRRFMDFLRRNNCLLDFRPYRKAAAGSS